MCTMGYCAHNPVLAPSLMPRRCPQGSGTCLRRRDIIRESVRSSQVPCSRGSAQRKSHPGVSQDALYEQHRGYGSRSCLWGMCVMRFGYRSLTRASTARLKKCCRCVIQYCSSDPSMPSLSVVPRISYPPLSFVSLFTAVRSAVNQWREGRSRPLLRAWRAVGTHRHDPPGGRSWLQAPRKDGASYVRLRSRGSVYVCTVSSRRRKPASPSKPAKPSKPHKPVLS
jgi:hypothetical protein